jgi:phospholipid/cholesterol/gamma-HCH transport system substrate-binding protein
MRTESRDERFRYVNPLVGVFFLLTVAVFVLAALGSGRLQGWLNPGTRIKVILPESNLFGLSEGADVEVLGTKSGRVVRIVIDPTQEIYAEIEIKNKMKVFVRQDSRAVIRKQFGVAGATYLDITRGFGAPMDWDYAVLKAEADRAPTESIGELINEVRDKLFPVIDTAQTAIQSFQAVAMDLRDPEGNLQQLLNGLETIAANIADGQGTVGRLIASKELADKLEGALSDVNLIIEGLMPILDELSVTVGNVSELSGTIRAQAQGLPELSHSLGQLLDSVNAVLTDLARVTPDLPKITRNVGDATADLPVLLIQTQETMNALEQLLKQLQSSWLLGGGGTREVSQESERISPRQVSP